MAQLAGRQQGLDRVIALGVVAAAVPGLPALTLALAALAGGYSWQPLPFNLVLPAVVLASAPLVAASISRLGDRRLGWLIVGVTIAVVTSLVAGAIALVSFLFAPLSLLDDSGNAIVNLNSILSAALLSTAAAVADAVLAVTMITTRHQPPGRGLPWRVLMTGGAAIGLAVAAAALFGWIGAMQTDAAGIPTGTVSRSWISARDEARLVYPGAESVQTFAGGESKQLGVGTPAEAVVYFYTSDARGVVAAWYGSALQARGWRPADALSLSTEAHQWAFRRGNRELFILELLTPGLYPGDAAHQGQQHFESRYTVLQSGGA